MLKHSYLNEQLNQRLKRKEVPHMLNNFLRCYLKETQTLSFQEKTKRAQFKAYLIYWNQKLLFNAPLAKTRTICFLTGRSRSVYRAFHLSRMKVREFAAMGFFSGLSKASW